MKTRSAKALIFICFIAFSNKGMGQYIGENVKNQLAEGIDTTHTTPIIFLAADKKTPITKITGDMEKFYIRYTISKENADKINPKDKHQLNTTVRAGQVSDVIKKMNICNGTNNGYIYNKWVIEDGYGELEITLNGAVASLLNHLKLDDTFVAGLKSGKQTYLLNFSLWSSHLLPENKDKIVLASGDINLEMDGAK